MPNDSKTTLSPEEVRDLRCVAGMMVPASDAFDVPGADDPAIFTDIVASVGRDLQAVKAALAALSDGGFADLEAAKREAVAASFRERCGAHAAVLARVILQCYYRDDRVVRSYTLEQGDWSLLDPVRKRPKMWRDASPPR